MTLMALDYGNYGIFLIMGNAGFVSSTIALRLKEQYVGHNAKYSNVGLAVLHVIMPNQGLLCGSWVNKQV